MAVGGRGRAGAVGGEEKTTRRQNQSKQRHKINKQMRDEGNVERKGSGMRVGQCCQHFKNLRRNKLQTRKQKTKTVYTNQYLRAICHMNISF